MATEDYIPAEDAQFRSWAEAFSAGISANSALYMLSPAQAASIASVVGQFVDALAVSSNQATRTRVTVAEKDDARSVCETLCRQYAMLIKENGGIADADKISIGVRPVNDSREPIECPQTSPLISILGNTPGQQELRYADTTTPDSRKKPFGASELQLFVATGTAENAPLADAKFYGKFTRNPVVVDFDAADDGKVATYYARWASARGEVGPWSLPVSMRIAA